MMKTNILQVKGAMNRGGSEAFLMNVLREINPEEVRFVFLCYGNAPFEYEDEIVELGSKIVRVKDVKEVGVVTHVRDLYKIIKSEDIDIIHAHTYLNSIFSLIAGFFSGVKIRIAHSHTTVRSQKESKARKLYSFLSRKMIRIFATNYFACGDDAGRALFGKKAFQIINNGIDIGLYSYDKQQRSILRDKLGISETTKVIGHVGRLVEPKNHSFIIMILKKLVSLDQNIKLVLIGDGPLRVQIKKQVKDLKLQNYVLLLGERADTNKLYNIMDVLIFPSLWEGLPFALIEAQANGLPCLISDKIDPAVDITSSLTVMSLEETDKSWANALNLISTTRLDNSKKIVNAKYDINSVVKQLMDVYTAHRGDQS